MRLASSPPKIAFDGYNKKYHYFTPFYSKERTSIVTGPICLRQEYKSAVEETLKQRRDSPPVSPTFSDIEEAVRLIDKQFCVLPELKAIHNLPTANKQHREGVGAHTRTVVQKLRESQYYKNLAEERKYLLDFAAYLHDIGKSDSPKDDQGNQKTDLDHPARAIPMLQRILTEEIDNLSDEDIRQVMLLVVYHDLISDVIGKGRNREQIIEVIESDEDFDMLAALCLADVASLIPDGGLALMVSPHRIWMTRIEQNLPELRTWILENMEEAG